MILKTPPMGFNTWNTFGENISEQLVIEIIDKIVELKLKDAGYHYVVIDDGWQASRRDENGNLREDPEKFPRGLKYVVDYAHSKGLKFGIYSCTGVLTCGGYPGSFGHEFEDARFFADTGCDYLKFDYCYTPNSSVGPKLYNKMAMALRLTGRDIVFSICNWGIDNVETWAKAAGGHLYRSTFDIFDNYTSFVKIFCSQLDKLYSAGFNCFNDMDMLTVGMYGSGNVGRGGCTFDEYVMLFSLWCLCGVPLMIGSDVRKLDKVCLSLLTNKYLRIYNKCWGQEKKASTFFI